MRLSNTLHRWGFAFKRIGLEAGPLSQWLYEGLTNAGFDVVLLETRHVKAALSAMIIKTDRKLSKLLSLVPRSSLPLRQADQRARRRLMKRNFLHRNARYIAAGGLQNT
jgi:transposase